MRQLSPQLHQSGTVQRFPPLRASDVICLQGASEQLVEEIQQEDYMDCALLFGRCVPFGENGKALAVRSQVVVQRSAD